MPENGRRAYAAFLRAVNVGGVTLAMNDLVALCDGLGFAEVRTLLASGNVVFRAEDRERDVKSRLEAALQAHTGKAVAVFLRSAPEIEAILAVNPFPEAPPERTIVFLLDAPPDASALEARGLSDERVAPGAREIYVHYPSGQGRSKLVLGGARSGTGRNINTLTKLRAAMGVFTHGPLA